MFKHLCVNVEDSSLPQEVRSSWSLLTKQTASVLHSLVVQVNMEVSEILVLVNSTVISLVLFTVYMRWLFSQHIAKQQAYKT